MDAPLCAICGARHWGVDHQWSDRNPARRPSKTPPEPTSRPPEVATITRGPPPTASDGTEFDAVCDLARRAGWDGKNLLDWLGDRLSQTKEHPAAVKPPLPRPQTLPGERLQVRDRPDFRKPDGTFDRKAYRKWYMPQYRAKKKAEQTNGAKT